MPVFFQKACVFFQKACVYDKKQALVENEYFCVFFWSVAIRPAVQVVVQVAVQLQVQRNSLIVSDRCKKCRWVHGGWRGGFSMVIP